MTHHEKPSIGGWIAILYATLLIGSGISGISDTHSVTTIAVCFAVALMISIVLWSLVMGLDRKTRHFR